VLLFNLPDLLHQPCWLSSIFQITHRRLTSQRRPTEGENASVASAPDVTGPAADPATAKVRVNKGSSRPSPCRIRAV
jgi:hypothetical protein